MLLAILIAAALGILAGLITNAFAKTKPYAGIVGLGVAIVVFLVQLGLIS